MMNIHCPRSFLPRENSTVQGREKLSKGGAAIYAVVAQHMYNRKFCQTNLQANKDARCVSKLMMGIAEGRRLVRLVTNRWY